MYFLESPECIFHNCVAALFRIMISQSFVKMRLGVDSGEFEKVEGPS